ncbi:MAG: HDOD domain-containing protein [Gammaproteobacteria bacterium]|nr:HDOD domain-containing protein [Gammaproteobacteria bacterium]MBU1731060.1 HDOD domain-containing protein [Gammaproteobacteria bacterium]MBU1894118.1 HDOD domain-containing protein [Gammaproteobacteria bacterium]
MAVSASDLVQDIGGLITLPDVFLRINRLIEDANSSIADIAAAVSQDPSFTVRLLRVANSALYSFPSSIDTVSRAVSIIGTSQLRNLALSMSVAKSFAGLPNELVSMDNFWRHSLLCALVARHLAKEMRRCDPDALFTAGLLHDIGELVIFNRLPQQSAEVLQRVLDSQDELPVHEAEREVLGFDHSTVGGELARQWNLPTLLQECIAHHHDIGAAQKHPRETALIHLANIIALMAEVDTLDPADVPPIDPHAWEVTGLDEAVVEPAMRAAQAEVVEIEKLFTDQK